MYHLSLKKEIIKKKNCRPFSILRHISKAFERILYKQIDTFMTTKFSPYLSGFRKNHNAQYSLNIWKWYKPGKNIGVILMDLSTKAFDTINYSLLFAKLDEWSFSGTFSKLMQNCLCKRQQRISVNGSFSNCSEVITGVPQSSTLGPFCLIYF